MNNQFHLTDEQLRLATSRKLPPGAVLDTDPAAAREGFLALGASLESAASDLSEADLISRLCREQTCSRSPATHNIWPLLLCGALAASALFAIVRIVTILPQANPEITIVPQPNRATAVQQPAPRIGRSTVDWNDPLDDEIALAAATIEHYRSRGTSFDNSLFDMNIQLEALSQELLRESL